MKKGTRLTVRKDAHSMEVIYIGEQAFPGMEPLRLFNLTSPLHAHPTDSTLSHITIESYGYTFEN